MCFEQNYYSTGETSGDLCMVSTYIPCIYCRVVFYETIIYELQLSGIVVMQSVSYLCVQ